MIEDTHHNDRTSAPSEDNLATLWALKYRILREIGELVERQIGCVKDDNIDGLLDILAHKQKFILRLRDVDREIRSLQREVVADHKGCPQAAEHTYSTTIEQCRILLESIIDAERKCEAELRLRRDAVLRDLAQLRDVAEARSAYVDNDTTPGYGLDLSL